MGILLFHCLLFRRQVVKLARLVASGSCHTPVFTLHNAAVTGKHVAIPGFLYGHRIRTQFLMLSQAFLPIESFSQTLSI